MVPAVLNILPESGHLLTAQSAQGTSKRVRSRRQSGGAAPRGRVGADEVLRAFETLRAAGVTVVLGGSAGDALRLFSVRQVAELWDVSPDWVRNHREQLQGRYIGNELRFPLAALRAFSEGKV